MSTRRQAPTDATDRMEALLEAGWRLIDELPLEAALGDVNSKRVAAGAGVTTGSFFHHFGSIAAFVDSLVLSLAHDALEHPDRPEELLDALDGIDVVGLMREAMVDRWRQHVAEPDRRTQFRREMLAWASNHRPLQRPASLPDGQEVSTVGDVLRHRVGSRQTYSTEVWGMLLDLAGRNVVEPFDVDRLATSLTAVFYGLAVRHAIEPGAVDDELFADLADVLMATLTKPVGSGRHLADVSAGLRHDWSDLDRSPQARTGARRRGETRNRIIDAATGMFANGWEAVSASEVAQRAGVSNQTVANLFPGVRAVAACTFRSNLAAVTAAAVTAAADEHRAGPADDLQRLRAALLTLAIRAAADPEPARALLSERIATASRRGEVLGDGDVRAEVPLSDALVAPIQQIVPHENATSTASTLVNLVLMEAVCGPGAPVDVVDRALRLLEPVEVTSERSRRGDGSGVSSPPGSTRA